jgi:AcrR family transcriptional regulator
MVETILDATTRILVKDGYVRLTTNGVAERAGISIGSLYQYFPNRDALITGVAQRYSDKMKSELSEILVETKSDGFKSALTAMIKGIAARNATNPMLNHILNHELPRLGNMEWRDEIAARSLAIADSLLAAHKSELRKDIDHKTAAFLIAKTVEAIMTSMGQAKAAKLDKDLIESSMIEMLLLFLVDSRQD